MTSLEFQPFNDNQNGRHLATNFFLTFNFQNSLETWHIYNRFSGSASLLVLYVLCETENEAAAAILVLSILINRSYFQLIALKPGIYRVTA